MIAAIRRSISAGGLCLLGLVSGCAPSASFNGHWLGNAGLKPSPGADPRVANTMGRVEIWITDDRFKMSESGIPLDGILRIDGQKAQLEFKGRFDRPIEDSGAETKAQYADVTIERRGDGTLLYRHPGTFDAPIKLESQPNP